MSKASKDDINCLIDAIVNPISHITPCRLPDGPNFPTIPLIDYITDSSVTVNVGPYAMAPSDVVGVVIWLQVGLSKITSFQYAGAPIYSCIAIPITSAGAPIRVAVTADVPNIQLSNYANTTYGPLALAKSLRVLAGGIRLLPQVEVVTNTAEQYITKYHTACISNSDLASWFDNASPSLLSLFETSRDFKDYSNMEGVCIRYDPLQYRRQLEFYSMENTTDGEWFDTDIINSDKWYSTCAFVRFNEAISPTLSGVDYLYTFPLRFYVKVWMEAQLKEPNTILPDMGVYDPKCEDLLIVTRRSRELFPCATSGHSFKSFYNKIKPFYNAASIALKGAATIFPTPYLVAADMANSKLRQVLNRNNLGKAKATGFKNGNGLKKKKNKNKNNKNKAIKKQRKKMNKINRRIEQMVRNG